MRSSIVLGITAACLTPAAQARTSPRRLAALDAGLWPALREELRGLGLAEGSSLAIRFRGAAAAEPISASEPLASTDPDAIRAIGAPAAAAAASKRPTRFELIVDQGIAARVKSALPHALLARADEVIG